MASYKLNPVEKYKAEKFHRKHYKKCDTVDISIIMTETGIGVNVNIQCNKCLKINDISNYENW
jgi:hypothetical protein